MRRQGELTIEIAVYFSVGVTVTCERKFAGSNGDPGFRRSDGSAARTGAG